MVQSFERRKMQKAGSYTFIGGSGELNGVSNDFLRMLGFSFLLFIIKSLFGTTFGQPGGFSTRSTPLLGFGVFPGLSRWALRFSTSCSHVPLCSFALSFYHITPLNFGHYAFRICLDFVFSRQKQKFEKAHKTQNQPPRNLRDQQTYIIPQYRLSNVLARSLIQSRNTRIS